MTQVTRRHLLTTSATAIVAACCANTTQAGVPDLEEWVAVQVHLQFPRSQEELLKPVMEDILSTFTRRVLVPHDDSKHPGVVRGMVYIELLDDKVQPHFWTFIHDEGGSILLATGTDQLKAALQHLRSVARKHQANDIYYSAAYDQGVPPVIKLPKGVTTSLPVHRAA